MFPKNTMATTAAMPSEKPRMTEKKDTTVLYVVDDTAPQTSSADNRNQRTLICACAVVMTTLILVAGALGAIAIVFRAHDADAVTFDIEPTMRPDREALSGQNQDPLSGNNPQLPELLPPLKPRIKIDDGGLWPPSASPDLIAVDGGVDQGIRIGDGDEMVPVGEGRGGDNDITIEGGDLGPDVIIASSSSSSSDPESSDDYENGRNYISSSFPYAGFYMRGEKGDPPNIGESWRSSPDIDTDSLGDSSGDSSGDSFPTDQDDDPEESFSDTSSSDTSSYSDPYVVSE